MPTRCYLLLLALPIALLGCGDDGPRTFVIKPIGNTMKYETVVLQAKAGERLRIILDNSETTAPSMYHNLVVLNTSDLAVEDTVMLSARQHGGLESGYQPDHPAVLAASPLANPGEAVEVNFIAPPPGRYTYFCTYPAHGNFMRGTLLVE